MDSQTLSTEIHGLSFFQTEGVDSISKKSIDPLIEWIL